MGFLDTIGVTRKITRPRQRAFVERYATDARTLDIGSGNKPYADLFPNLCTVDAQERAGTKLDFIADAHDLSVIASGSFQVVLCTEVLEHLHSPQKAIAEFRRILAPGGLLLLTTRFVYPLHEVPVDYYRYTKYGLRFLLKDFDIIELREETNTVETLAVLFQRLGFQCTTLWAAPFKLWWFLLAKFTLLFSGIITKEYGDIHHQAEETNILSSGYYVAARVKP